jgi:hypothetical protein
MIAFSQLAIIERQICLNRYRCGAKNLNLIFTTLFLTIIPLQSE